MSIKQFYARTKEGRLPKEWQCLEEYTKNMAALARKFVEVFEYWA